MSFLIIEAVMPVLCGYRLNLTYERITGKLEVIRTSEKSAHRQVRSIGDLALAKLLITPVSMLYEILLYAATDR
ncbi:MAG TPA: hypothetical protein VK638_12805 [Edaphobacter sp.]|nr:hypothetical protein [Edaphobacter sp.]